MVLARRGEREVWQLVRLPQPQQPAPANDRRYMSTVTDAVVTGAEGKQHASIDCLIDGSATPGEDPRFRAIFGAIIGNAGECAGASSSQ